MTQAAALKRPLLEETPPDEAPGQKCLGKLLVVDDIAENRMLLSRRFSREGFEIVEAEGGEAALRLLREKSFDAVLLDVMMPILDGNQTLARIRQLYSPSELPVIMVTGKSQSRDIVEALTQGANDYITKPVDFQVALARVNNQIGVRRARAEADESIRALQAANAAINSEVARRTESELRNNELARYDLLTKLPNRFTFDERLHAALAAADEEAHELALLYLDLDGFKHVNDTLGHAVGDEVLKLVAAKLSATIGAEDVCARLGGDEFAVLHASDDVAGTAAALAQRLIAELSGCYLIGGVQVFLGASVGVATSRRGELPAAALLRHADLAMYRAKASGQGGYRFFETEMAERVERRRALELDLRRALAHGEFRMHYQPVVDTRAGRAVGAEALLRWEHPERGLVSPALFVPVAEETGLILQMGEWALRQACADAANWPDGARVAVNLSPVQFRNDGLIATVMSALAAAGLPPERLELEITESVVLDHSAHNNRLLQRLREMGVRIALDDFGSGYSGLGYFKAFHFDRVKIDQAFVRDMHDEPASRAIIRAALGLCCDLGMSLTAEGVETEAQLDVLTREGCHYVQGWLFSKALPQVELATGFAAIERRLRHFSQAVPK